MGEVRIEIEAEDESEDVLQGAKENLEDLRVSTNSAGEAFSTFATETARAASAIEHSVSLMTRLDIMQLTVQQSAERAAEAQERYNEAVTEFGQGSEQAQTAARDMERAQVELEKANKKAELSLGLVAAQSLTMAAQIPAAVTGLAALATAELSAATAGAALANTLTLGAATIGIVAGVTAVSMAFKGLTHEADSARIAITNVGKAAEAQKELMELTAAIETLEKRLKALREDERPIFTWENQNALSTEHIALEEQLEAALRRRKEVQQEIVNLQQQEANEAAQEQRAETERLNEAWTATKASFEAAGVSFSNMSTTMLQEIARLGGESAGAMLALEVLADRGAQVAVIERELGYASAETTKTLLAQAAAAVDKTGKHWKLDQMLADGTITEEQYAEAVATSEKDLRGQGAAATDSARAMASANAAAERFATLPGWAATDLRNGAMPGDITDVHRRRLDLASLFNTSPDVDVTGIKKGTYAPFGQGFKGGGSIGSTDFDHAYGSRTIVFDRGDGVGAQGNTTVNMGGVTIVVQARDVATGREAVVGAVRQIQGIAASQRVY